MPKRIPLLALVLCLLAVLSGCTGSAARAVYGDDARIAGEDCYSIGSFSGTVDAASYGGTYARASGSRSLWVYSCPAPESHSVDCTLSLTRGRAKLVLVTPDGQVDTLLEVSANAPVTASVLTLDTPTGVSTLKLVMDDVGEMTLKLGFDGGTSWHP